MANSFTGNVIFVDTDNSTFTYARNIKTIKYVGNTSGTLTIKKGSSSGSVLWAGDGATDFTDADLDIRSSTGIHVALTNGASAYIYLE